MPGPILNGGIAIGTNGANDPPPQTKPGLAHVVGSVPTGVWANNAGELAIEAPEVPGGFLFIGKAAMKDMTFQIGGTRCTYSGTAFTPLSTTQVLHREYYNRSSTFGTVTGSTPTLVATAPTIASATDPEQHTIGLACADLKTSWAHFGFFCPPNTVSATVLPTVGFFLTGAPSALDTVRIDVIGVKYADNDATSAGTTFNVGATIDLTAYGAGDYVVATLADLGITVNTGDYIQGVIARDAQVGNANDIYADTITLVWSSFKSVV